MTPENRRRCGEALVLVRNHDHLLETYVLRAYWKGRLHVRRYRSKKDGTCVRETLAATRGWLEHQLAKTAKVAAVYQKSGFSSMQRCFIELSRQLEAFRGLLDLHDELFGKDVPEREERLRGRLAASDTEEAARLAKHRQQSLEARERVTGEDR